MRSIAEGPPRGTAQTIDVDMRSAVETLRPLPHPTEKEAPPHEVKFVEEAPKPSARKPRPVEKVVFDARLTTSPGKKPPLHGDPPEIKLLVEKATQQDAESFGQLYDLYIDRMYRHFYFRSGNNNEVAEDLAAQVFLNAYQAINRYKDTGRPFLVWLLSIAHNLLVDHYRRKQDSENIEDIIIPDKNRDYDPVDFAERRLESETLRRAIGKLKRDQQAVVVMRFIDGMGHKEIATILNKKEGAVRIILFRALLALRGIMGTEEVPVSQEKEGKINEEPPEERFSYKALAEILGMNNRTLAQRVMTAEKRGQLELSTSLGEGKKRLTRGDLAAILTFLGKDPSLAAKL